MKDTVCAMVVTYRDRQSMAMSVVQRAISEGVSAVIVVLNGVSWRHEHLRQDWGIPEHVDLNIIDNSRNLGSAPAFHQGMEAFLRMDYDYLWILDDDTAPVEGCLATLLRATQSLKQEHNSAVFAVNAYREEHHRFLRRAAVDGCVFSPVDSFIGFHMSTIVRKIRRRIFPALVSSDTTSWVRTDSSIYGGLLISRDDMAVVGTSIPEFCLYADDTEWTQRIWKWGKGCFIIDEAQLEDLDSSWNTHDRDVTSFERWALMGSELQVYYAFRNNAYLSWHIRPYNHKIILAMNTAMYMSVLFALCAVTWRWGRLRTIHTAFMDALSKRLGESRLFPLS